MKPFPSWRTNVELGACASLLNGFAFASECFSDDDGVPLIRIRDLRSSDTEINFSGKFETKYLVRTGDILIGMDGDFETVKWKGEVALLNQRVCKLESKDQGTLDQQFLFYRVIDEVSQINRITAATTVKHLSSRDVLEIKLDLPPKLEQAKIAEVLSTLDRAIEQTEALIAKQQRIKTGLMQDLLSRGIDEHGNIRSEATHTFKDSPLGRIPLEWICAPLMKFVPIAEYGISTELGDTGMPVLRMNNFVDGEADVADLKYSSFPVPDSLLLKDGDVLFNRTNSWEHVGRTGIWRDQVDQATFASYLVRLTPNSSVLNPELLSTWLNWEPTQIAMRRLATPAVQQVNINPTNLRSIFASFPESLDEQNEIVRRLTGIRRAIDATLKKMDKLRKMKAGLMHDLLTGKRRVTALLEKDAAN